MKIIKQNQKQIKKNNTLKRNSLCLVLATFKEKVENVNLVELGN